MSMIGLRWAVCEDTPRARAAAEKLAHDGVIASIARVGRRTSGVVWHYYDPAAAAVVLAAALRAGVVDEATRTALLLALDHLTPAVLLTAEAEYEPAQRYQA
jgi:hypothetical protein